MDSEPTKEPPEVPKDARRGATESRILGYARFKEVIVELLPDRVKRILEKGLLPALLALVAIVVVVPMLVTFLAAFWLTVLAKSDLAIVKGLRTFYLETIYDGFAVEDVVSRSHQRLDYLQSLDFSLQRKSPRKNFIINIQQGQEVILDFSAVTFTAIQDGCTAPEPDVELVSVSLGDQPVMTLRTEFNVSKTLA